MKHKDKFIDILRVFFYRARIWFLLSGAVLVPIILMVMGVGAVRWLFGVEYAEHVELQKGLGQFLFGYCLISVPILILQFFSSFLGFETDELEYLAKKQKSPERKEYFLKETEKLRRANKVLKKIKWVR